MNESENKVVELTNIEPVPNAGDVFPKAEGTVNVQENPVDENMKLQHAKELGMKDGMEGKEANPRQVELGAIGTYIEAYKDGYDIYKKSAEKANYDSVPSELEVAPTVGATPEEINMVVPTVPQPEPMPETPEGPGVLVDEPKISVEAPNDELLKTAEAMATAAMGDLLVKTDGLNQTTPVVPAPISRAFEVPATTPEVVPVEPVVEEPVVNPVPEMPVAEPNPFEPIPLTPQAPAVSEVAPVEVPAQAPAELTELMPTIPELSETIPEISEGEPSRII